MPGAMLGALPEAVQMQCGGPMHVRTYVRTDLRTGSNFQESAAVELRAQGGQSEMEDPQRIDDLLGDGLEALKQAGERFGVERTGPREPIPAFVRVLVLKRDRFRCDWCGRHGSDQAFHLDHIKPWSAGGSDDTTNLRVLCPECNEMRSNYRTDAPYTRRMPCTPMCLPCLGWDDLGRDVFDDDEVRVAFCGECNARSWVPVNTALWERWGCRIV